MLCEEDVQATSYGTSNCLYWTVFAVISLDIQKQMSDMSMDHAIIPGGLMSILQPAEVSVNKLLKDYVQRFYSELMAAGPYDLSPTGKTQKTLLKIICKWNIQSWELISEEIIINS
jgi:hypothetical protein